MASCWDLGIMPAPCWPHVRMALIYDGSPRAFDVQTHALRMIVEAPVAGSGHLSNEKKCPTVYNCSVHLCFLACSGWACASCRDLMSSRQLLSGAHWNGFRKSFFAPHSNKPTQAQTHREGHVNRHIACCYSRLHRKEHGH